MVNKKIILQLALATIVGMPLAAIVIDRISDDVDLATSIIGVQAWWLQVAWGLAAGLVAAFVAQLIINSSLLKNVNQKYSRMLGRFDLTMSEIIFISVCAGVGEEMLFRGAIQPLMGILLTSVFFVAIHGYLNPKDWKLSIYGLYMTIVIAGVGFLAQESGLISAMIAHTVIDIYLLYKMQESEKEVIITENPNLSDPYAGDENEMES